MICSACNKPCEAYPQDEGIGRYDYGGAGGFHTDIRAYSECCDSQVVDEHGRLVRCKDVFDDFDEPDDDWY